MEKSNFYIDAIKFGDSKTRNGFSFEEFETHMKEKGYKPINTFDNGEIHSWIYILDDLAHQFYKGSDTIYFLTSDSHFNLLDYIELQEARKSSKQAMSTAIIAIFLNVAGLFIALFNTSTSCQ